MHRKQLLFLFLFVALIGTLGLAVLLPRGPQATLVVGIDPTFPPFATRQADGQFAGFDVDLAAALAKQLNSRLEFREIPFRDLLTSLQEGLVQLVISGMPIRPDRDRLADFSLPYYDATQVAVVLRSETRPINRLEDLATWTLAVRVGTSGEFEAIALKGTEQDKSLLRMYEIGPMFKALKDGMVQALFVDRQVALRYVAGDPELQVVQLDFWEEKYAVAVPEGQQEMLRQINSILTAWLDSPAYEQSLTNWFGPHN